LRIDRSAIFNAVLQDPSRVFLPVGAAILAYEATMKVVQRMGLPKFEYGFFSAGLFFSLSVTSTFRAQIVFATAVVSYIVVSLVPKAKDSRLPHFLSDMLKKAASEEKWGLCVSNERFVEAIEDALGHPDTKNLLLIGEPGVGKSLRVENLAWRIHHKRGAPLASMTIYSLDVNAFLAGTKYVGELQRRCAELIAFSKENPTSVIFVDEVYRLMNAGATHEDPSGVSDCLKEAMARGELRLIGATTPLEHQKLMAQDTAFDRRWHQYKINPPNGEECFDILKGKREFFQKIYGNLIITDEAIRVAIRLSDVIPNRFQPDKAQNVLTKACATAARARRTKKEESAEITIVWTHVVEGFKVFCREIGVSDFIWRHALVVISSAERR
ncbi:MAG: AAA family ATPase, partial [Thermodesulfobacteriota bacterium]